MNQAKELPQLAPTEPATPDVASLFQKAGVPAERARDLTERYRDNLDIMARHAARIV